MHCGLLVDAQKNEGKGQLIASWAASKDFATLESALLAFVHRAVLSRPKGSSYRLLNKSIPIPLTSTYDDIEGLGREDEEAEGEKENKKSVLPKHTQIRGHVGMRMRLR